jgi:hypothetical protein
MTDAQGPWGRNALGGTISEAAWRVKPSWYLRLQIRRTVR